tara:strand:+ start:2003 stop:2446 length:444 start_codon:yes stop_codon:yes gene_type:complete
MSKFHITTNIPSPPEELIKMATQFDKMPGFFQYLKDIKVLEEKENEFRTEETITFTYHKLTHTISQQTITKLSANQLEAKIISGPLKNSQLITTYEKTDQGSKVIIDAELKVGLKYRFLSPIITKRIKMASIAVLYKMHTAISDMST